MMVERDLYAPSAATLAGDNADIYFRRSCDILEAEQLNPVVAMEVFTRRRALLCGMCEAQASCGRCSARRRRCGAWTKGIGSSRAKSYCGSARPTGSSACTRRRCWGCSAARRGGPRRRRSAWPRQTGCRLSASVLGISIRRSALGWNTRPSSGDALDAPLRKGPLSLALRQPGPCPTP